MTIIAVIQFLIVVAVVVYLTVNIVHLVKIPSIVGPLHSSPFISICVPARNEERDIEACLRSLLAQDYPHFEVITVDDGSTDKTAEIIESLALDCPCLTFIRGATLPVGWLGKPYALHQAFKKARGEYLLFTDADPVFQPAALTSAMYCMQTRKLDVLTLMPGAQFGSFWERAVQPVIFGFIGALTRFKKVNSQKYPDAMGVGAFIMFKKDVYERVGGHERVKQEIVEDIAIARRVKREGFNLLIADGKSIFSIRMYHSLREIWEGWRKNMFVAMKQSAIRTVYYIFVILCFVVTPYGVFFYNLMSEKHLFLPSMALSLAIITGMQLCEELKLEKRNVFLFPLGALIMSAVMLNSMAQILIKGRTEWRGRYCPLPELEKEMAKPDRLTGKRS